MRFWKIAVWGDTSGLHSIALLADQRPVLKVMPEAIGAEAFGDEEELARVSEFLSTVAEIESLSGLDFGDAVRDADILAGMGESGAPALTFDPAELGNSRPRRRSNRRKPRQARKRKKR
jgi:endonuclease G